MQREIDDRHIGAKIGEIMPKLSNRQHNNVVQMAHDGRSAKEIWKYLQDEGIVPANDE